MPWFWAILLIPTAAIQWLIRWLIRVRQKRSEYRPLFTSMLSSTVLVINRPIFRALSVLCAGCVSRTAAGLHLLRWGPMMRSMSRSHSSACVSLIDWPRLSTLTVHLRVYDPWCVPGSMAWFHFLRRWTMTRYTIFRDDMFRPCPYVRRTLSISVSINLTQLTQFRLSFSALAFRMRKTRSSDCWFLPLRFLTQTCSVMIRSQI